MLELLDEDDIPSEEDRYVDYITVRCHEISLLSDLYLQTIKKNLLANRHIDGIMFITDVSRDSVKVNETKKDKLNSYKVVIDVNLNKIVSEVGEDDELIYNAVIKDFISQYKEYVHFH